MSFFRFLFSKAFLIQLVLALVATVLIIFLLLQWLDFSTNQDQKIAVPDLARLTLDQVDAQLEELDLRREIQRTTIPITLPIRCWSRLRWRGSSSRRTERYILP